MLETMCEVLKHSYNLGLISTRDGNASIRHKKDGHFYITPSGVRKQNLQYTHYKKIDVVSGLSMDYTQESIGMKPSGELPLHYGLMKRITTGVRCVVHLHPTYTVAAMHRGIELSTLCEKFPELSRYTNVGPNVGMVPPISKELADKTHKAMGLDSDGSTKYDIVGIDGHGVVAVGETPWQTFEHIERLEHICKIVLVSGNV
tara:strand:+ start:2734 stop:3339 length:606 start_codon:yes stop_codon:yes gene_type:complete